MNEENEQTVVINGVTYTTKGEFRPLYDDASKETIDTELKISTKEYIEVNSAIALALEGLGFANKELNFAPVSKLDNLENITKEDFDLKKMLTAPINIEEKSVVRIILVYLDASSWFVEDGLTVILHLSTGI